MTSQELAVIFLLCVVLFGASFLVGRYVGKLSMARQMDALLYANHQLQQQVTVFELSKPHAPRNMWDK